MTAPVQAEAYAVAAIANMQTVSAFDPACLHHICLMEHLEMLNALQLQYPKSTWQFLLKL